MSDLKVTKAIFNKIKEYDGNKEVKKALNELYNELFNDYHGLHIEDVSDPIPLIATVYSNKPEEICKLYDVYVNTNNLSKVKNLYLCKEIKKRYNVSFSDAVNILKQDKVLILDKASYKEAIEKRKELFDIDIKSYVVISTENAVDNIYSYPNENRTKSMDIIEPYNCQDNFYDISVKTKSLDDHQKKVIATLLRKKMPYIEAYDKMKEKDEILVLELLEDDVIDMYKDLLDSKKIQYKIIKL